MDSFQMPSKMQKGEIIFNEQKQDSLKYIIAENKPLGEGTYGSAWLASIQGQPDKSVVIKIMKRITFPQHVQEIQQKLYNRESQALEKLNSQNIIKIYEHWQTNQQIFMVLEYCNGSTLSEYIKQQKQESLRSKKVVLSERKALQIVGQLLNGMKEMQRHRICHRDLKPDNIMLNDEEVKIIDLGTSKQIKDEDDELQTYIGTPLYMAPEVIQLEEGDTYDFSCDIYSIGVILYEMVFGDPPYDLSSIKGSGPTLQILNQIKKGNINYNRNEIKISPQLQELIAQMIHKNYKQRIPLDKLFQHQLLVNVLQPNNKQQQQQEGEFKNMNLFDLVQSSVIKEEQCMVQKQEQQQQAQQQQKKSQIQQQEINNQIEEDEEQPVSEIFEKKQASFLYNQSFQKQKQEEQKNNSYPIFNSELETNNQSSSVNDNQNNGQNQSQISSQQQENKNISMETPQPHKNNGTQSFCQKQSNIQQLQQEEEQHIEEKNELVQQEKIISEEAQQSLDLFENEQQIQNEIKKGIYSILTEINILNQYGKTVEQIYHLTKTYITKDFALFYILKKMIHSFEKLLEQINTKYFNAFIQNQSLISKFQNHQLFKNVEQIIIEKITFLKDSQMMIAEMQILAENTIQEEDQYDFENKYEFNENSEKQFVKYLLKYVNQLHESEVNRYINKQNKCEIEKQHKYLVLKHLFYVLKLMDIDNQFRNIEGVFDFDKYDMEINNMTEQQFEVETNNLLQIIRQKYNS